MNIRTSVVLPALIMRRDSPHATRAAAFADEQTGGLQSLDLPFDAFGRNAETRCKLAGCGLWRGPQHIQYFL